MEPTTNDLCDRKCMVDLPTEDNVWFIEEVVDSESFDCQKKFIKITDKICRTIGLSHCYYDNSFDSQTLLEFICSCTLCPSYQKPRKPKLIVLKKACSRFQELDMTKCGIKVYSPDCRVVDTSHDSYVWTECYHCHIRAEEKFFELCHSCEGVYYCSPQCRKKDLDNKGNPMYAHNVLCNSIRKYMQLGPQLAHFPFLFMPDKMSCSLSDRNYREFLMHYNVEGKGLWKWELPDKIMSTAYDTMEESYVLPAECSILESEVTLAGSDKVTDWESYYKCRGLDLSSPIALLLHWPLTLWYIIQHCIKQDYDIVMKNPEIDIHVIGVEKEVMLMPVFQELGNLLPENLINITMYGRNFPKKMNGSARMFGNVCIQVCRKLYHNVPDAPVPDLVIGFNAGIAAYPSWLETLKKIHTMKCPAYFTDCCQLTIDISKEVVADSLDIYLSHCKVNPFRSPIRVTAPDDRLPRYSNAFMFHMLKQNVETGVT